MLSRWQGGLASVAVVIVTVVMVVLDNTDDGVRHYFDDHAFTNNTFAGLLVLALTVLVVDQVTSLRQVQSRSLVVATQAAIVMAQAGRATRSVHDWSVDVANEDEDDARGELQSYVTLLSIATPVLIDTAVSRTFLEDAQRLAVELGYALRSQDVAAGRRPPNPDAAVDRLRVSAAPLLHVLDARQRDAVAVIDTPRTEVARPAR